MRNNLELYSNNGLGNDLFLIFAGLSILEEKPVKLLINRSRIPVNHKETYLGSRYLEFILGGVEVDQVFKDGNSRLVVIVRKNVYRVFSKLNLTPLFYREYRSRTVGYDSKIENLNSPIRLYGYYQTYRFFEKVKKCFGKIEIVHKNPSDWFKKTASLLANDANSCAVHLRRGDYLVSENRDLYGVLDVNYFISECKKRSNANPDLTFYIFSDDLNASLELSARLGQLRNVVVDDAKSNDPAETLLAMSKCRSFIIANSTFSYWAAILSDRPSFTVVPSKWYRNMPDPDQLIPEHWEKAEPVWL